MTGHEEILLKQIINNQDKHEGKLDDLADAVQGVKENLGITEQRIMVNVRKEFVRHEEFPKLWNGQMACKHKERMDKIESSTKLAGHFKTWLGWGLAVVMFIASQGENILRVLGR